MEQFSLEKYLENPSRKVVTRFGKPVRIVCWDAPTKNPIYGFVEGYDGITSWRKDGRFSNLIDNVDLFFADEEELTDFEIALARFAWKGIDTNDLTKEAKEILHKDSKPLLDLARKELLKDLLKWKKSTEHKDLEMHIAILEDNKVLLSNYLEEGDYYIVLDHLKTLPKEE